MIYKPFPFKELEHVLESPTTLHENKAFLIIQYKIPWTDFKTDLSYLKIISVKFLYQVIVWEESVYIIMKYFISKLDYYYLIFNIECFRH